jgi:D-alanyl-D-alanine carboxypeptidase (penicillin-binding protein 5/6)
MHMTTNMRSLLVLAVVTGMTWAQAQDRPVPVPPPAPTPKELLAAKAAEPKPIPAPPQLEAASYILMDFNSLDVLVEHNADQRVEPASITKLMTSYVVFKALAAGDLTLEETVVVSERAWRSEGSRMFIDPTMTPTVEQLIKGMIIQSGNDACVALAEHIAGSEEAFADLMNHYAKELGMTGTHFADSTGMPSENHYTTAHDIALLSAAIIREFPEYYAWYSEKEFTFNEIKQPNRNTLLWRDPAVDGLKTGHTESAGYCLAASALRDGMRLISVVMNSASESTRASESQTLLNYGFRFFETVQLYEAGAELAKTRVWKGQEDEIALGVTSPLFVTIPRGRYAELDGQVELPPTLSAPLAAGEVVGSISVSLGEEPVAKRDLVALTAVEEAGFFGRTWDSLRLWTGGLFSDEDEDEVKDEVEVEDEDEDEEDNDDQ